MNFNFGNIAETNFAGNSVQHLKPYGIYNVNLTKIEKTEIKGSKDPNAVYPVIALEFTGINEDSGIFSTNLFIPSSEKDMERPVYTNAEGHEYQGVSAAENFQYTLMQLVHVLNPSGEAKIKANGSKITTVDQFVDLILKALKDKNNVPTKLKLVGRNNNGTIYAALPKACGIDKSGKIFATNFIGDNLFFSNYELSQQKKFQSAKPTNMDEIESPDKADSSLDLDDLEF